MEKKMERLSCILLCRKYGDTGTSVQVHQLSAAALLLRVLLPVTFSLPSLWRGCRKRQWGWSRKKMLFSLA